MQDYIWDGEMDCGWRDLSDLIVKSSSVFAEVMLETVSYSSIEEAIELISKESMDRLCLIAKQLATLIVDGERYQYEDLDEDSQNATRLTCWILLGSLTETALQMFLAFYIDDYKRSQWQQWTDFPAEDVKKSINSYITKMVDEKIIDNSQGRSLKRAIKDTIKNHSVEHPVKKVMLDEIIQYYEENNLLDDEDIEYLRIIQSNRNGIHSFENRKIGNWNDLKYGVRFWCYLLEWIQFRLPDVPDYD